MAQSNRFSVGDIVVNKKSGKYWQVCRYVNYCGEISLKPCPPEYGLPTGKNKTYSPRYNLKKVPAKELEQKKMEKELYEMEKLYEFLVDGRPTYGTHMATNSEGLWVMDVKGSQPVAVKKEDCTEVIPHSIKVKSFKTGDIHHMMAEKGKFSSGEMFVAETGGIYLVLEVDTKERTTKTFKPVTRILTEKVT